MQTDHQEVIHDMAYDYYGKVLPHLAQRDCTAPIPNDYQPRCGRSAWRRARATARSRSGTRRNRPRLSDPDSGNRSRLALH